jgi:hypothetical protein
MQLLQNVSVEPGIHSWPVGTGALRYHNCLIDGGTSPEYFGYHLVYLTFAPILVYTHMSTRKLKVQV